MMTVTAPPTTSMAIQLQKITLSVLCTHTSLTILIHYRIFGNRYFSHAELLWLANKYYTKHYYML